MEVNDAWPFSVREVSSDDAGNYDDYLDRVNYNIEKTRVLESYARREN